MGLRMYGYMFFLLAVGRKNTEVGKVGEYFNNKTGK